MTSIPPPDDDSRRQQGQAGASDPSVGSYFDSDLPTGFVVPDDLSALDDEVRAYRRERARDRRSRALSRVFLTRRWYRYGLSGPIVVAVLLVVGLGGALLSFFAPAPGQRPVPPPLVPLAGSPGPVAVAGGLLPQARLSGEEGRVAARTVRPAVMMVLPAGCGCATLVHDVATQVDNAVAGLQTAAVAPSADPVLTELAANPGAGSARIRPLADVDGTLERAFAQAAAPAAPGGPAAPLLLVVRSDGRLAGAPLPVHQDDPVHQGDRVARAIAPLVPAR